MKKSQLPLNEIIIFLFQSIKSGDLFSVVANIANLNTRM